VAQTCDSTGGIRSGKIGAGCVLLASACMLPRYGKCTLSRLPCPFCDLPMRHMYVLVGCIRCPAGRFMLLQSAMMAAYTPGETAYLASWVMAITSHAAAPGKLLRCRNIGRSL
jgi:hypothetical protein